MFVMGQTPKLIKPQRFAPFQFRYNWLKMQYFLKANIFPSSIEIQLAILNPHSTATFTLSQPSSLPPPTAITTQPQPFTKQHNYHRVVDSFLLGRRFCLQDQGAWGKQSIIHFEQVGQLVLSCWKSITYYSIVFSSALNYKSCIFLSESACNDSYKPLSCY